MLGTFLVATLFLVIACVEVGFFVLVTLLLYRVITRKFATKRQVLWVTGVLGAIFALTGILGDMTFDGNGGIVFSRAYYVVVYFLAVLFVGAIVAKLSEKRSKE